MAIVAVALKAWFISLRVYEFCNPGLDCFNNNMDKSIQVEAARYVNVVLLTCARLIGETNGMMF